MQKNFSKFESFTFISITNKNNNIKLISPNGEITTISNYIFTYLHEIKGIFIKAFEDDVFEILLIPEEITKYMTENSLTFFDFIFLENKKYKIDFLYIREKSFIYYNILSDNLKIYELEEETIFNLEDFINNNLNNISQFSGLKAIEKQKSYIILKESSAETMLYEKYLNKPFDFIFILDHSKICFLFMDFEYIFIYNKSIKKILLKSLNNNNQLSSINIICGNENIKMTEEIQIINIEKCEGEFIISGNNSLIFFYIPLIQDNSYTIIDNKDSFDLSNINYFFFVPKKNDYKSINIIISIDYENKEFPVYFSYSIEYGIIPYYY